MSTSLKRMRFLQLFQLTQHNSIKFKGPLILRMFGQLNILDLRNENRYILCNFLDQNSDIFNIQEDIYKTNNEKSLNQLFLLAYNKAMRYNLLEVLYDEYVSSINAISQKKEFNVLII